MESLDHSAVALTAAPFAVVALMEPEDTLALFVL